MRAWLESKWGLVARECGDWFLLATGAWCAFFYGREAVIRFDPGDVFVAVAFAVSSLFFTRFAATSLPAMARNQIHQELVAV